MISEYLPLFYSVLSIIWINILLSGDNALVIALVCEELPEKQRKIGILLGSLGAILARIVFLFVAAYLLTIPGLHFVGGAFLFYVAWTLWVGSSGEEAHKPSESLWSAVTTIMIADVMMSLDNVIAVTAAAKGNLPLVVFGVLASMPIIFGGATLLTKLIERYPALVKVGVALIVWVGFETIIDEPAIHHYLETIPLVKNFLG